MSYIALDHLGCVAEPQCDDIAGFPLQIDPGRVVIVTDRKKQDINVELVALEKLILTNRRELVSFRLGKGYPNSDGCGYQLIISRIKASCLAETSISWAVTGTVYAADGRHYMILLCSLSCHVSSSF